MRLWTIDPSLLDNCGLTTAWREALLAQAALQKPEMTYYRHSQLERFRGLDDPLAAVGDFLAALWDEAKRRGMKWTDGKILRRRPAGSPKLRVRRGQLEYEWRFLRAKMAIRKEPHARRSREHLARVGSAEPAAHPLFEIVDGDGPEPWERVKAE